MIWYYIDESIVDGDRRKGPYSLEEIKNFVQEKKILPETLVWHSGMEAFTPWKDMEESKEQPPLSEEELLKQTIEVLLSEKQGQKLYAGFFPRALAFLLDTIIITTLGIFIFQVLSVLHVLDQTTLMETISNLENSGNRSLEEMVNTLMNDPNMELMLIISSIIQAVYFIAFTTLKGATPGKMLLHMHVESADGTRVGWITGITRYVASIFTQFTLMLYGFGYLIVLIDPKRRALHDHIAKTRVVLNTRIRIVERPKNGQEK